MSLHHDVNTLAGRHDVLVLTVLRTQRIDPHAGGIDDAACMNRIRFSSQHVIAGQARDLALCEQQSRRLHVVEQQRALAGSCSRQGHSQLCIVKLSVPILNAAAQPLRLDRRQGALCFAASQESRRPKARSSGQGIVHFQTEAIKSSLPPSVGRHHKSQGLGYVRRIAQ